jgi:hypothetical protein
LAAVAVVLALAPAVGVNAAATGVGLVWATCCVTAGRLHEPLALVGTVAQVACLVLLAVGSAVVVTKLHLIDLPRRLS